jgi:uncharacterized protein (DUF2126 family)
MLGGMSGMSSTRMARAVQQVSIDAGMLDEIRTHDSQVARSGVEIWIGAEPTFTNPRSLHPCWLTEALGSEKEAHANALLRAVARRMPGRAQLRRVLGRHYPGEPDPRFCMGALFDRYAAQPAMLDDSELDSQTLLPTPVPRTDQAWLTVTPDPGVVEVNMAPAHDLLTFARWTEAVYAAAYEAGLSPLRYRYNGDVADSGGAGQITLGGPTPRTSPFLVRPQLLPGLVRYLNRHPSLSYLFAPSFCGSASQAPRTDESARERFEELPVALDYLARRGDACTPAELWATLSPLLVDSSGCSHRAEVNIEKLWNPGFGSRGQLGLAELRALRMPPTAARMTALAALFRSLTAHLASNPYLAPIIDWGAELHERFALPWFLEQDLEHVLSELEAHGFGLGPTLCQALRSRPEPIGALELGDAALELHAAVSFWPLIGDAATVSQHGARLVDASTSRLQLLVRAPERAPWGRISANGWLVPLQAVPAGEHACAVGSVLYRTFVPYAGLHPYVGAHDPLTIEWERDGHSAALRLHAWRPGGGGYAGLPADGSEAEFRRAERVQHLDRCTSEFRSSRASGFTLDLRRNFD